MLESIRSAEDLQELSYPQLDSLSTEIRKFLIEKVSRSGGHLGPNLGIVELTLAMHRVFHSPTDVFLYDTGHQSYVHKILTGRLGNFDKLRQRGGISGYPNRRESVHDVIENSHASGALSWADGIAKAFKLKGESDRKVVCLVGDGSLTGGMAWEALNNIAANKNLPLVIILNDNERSYSPTTGGIATYLSTLRSTHGYKKFRKTKDDLKDLSETVTPSGMFEDLGLKYSGPIDGHNIEEIEEALKEAKSFSYPILIHVITEKGRGYSPAIKDEAEKFHAIGIVDPKTGQPISTSGQSWTKVFSEELVEIGSERQDVVAITAAMLGPTGLAQFSDQFPDRTFDVGIAEQHAVTSAAGMAFAGLHPVIAVYSTFLNRAFDQLLLDVALHKAGVTFVLDRAGITGDDGPSHHGIWDLALTSIVPGLHVAAPRDGFRLKEVLREAIEISDAPSLLRFPKGAVQSDISAIERCDGVDILYRGESADVLLVSVGAMASIAVEAAALAHREGVGVTVVDPRWVKPLPTILATMAQQHKTVVVLEDGIKNGGVANSIADVIMNQGLLIPIRSIGVPLEFIEHSKRQEILNDLGITVQNIARSLVSWSSSTNFEAEMPLLRDEIADL